jgi:hypothetical protein
MPAQTRPIKILPDITAGRKPVGSEGVLVLRALNDVDCVGEAARRAGVIEVQMRKEYIGNARWIDFQAFQLRYTALFGGHGWKVEIGDSTPLGMRVIRAFDRVAAVNHEISLWMLNKKPRNRDFIRLVQTLVHFDVVEFTFKRAALEHVQTKICHRFFWGYWLRFLHG